MALRPGQTPPPQTPKTPRQPGSWLRLALLAGLSLYIVILLSPVLTRLGGPARVDLSYSQLVTQVEAGNVADITSQGQSAQGDLKALFTNNGVTNTQFTATVPDNVGLTDPTFFPLLKSNHVATAVKQDNGGLGSLLLSFLPFLALIAIWIWFVRRSGQAAQGIFSFGRSRARLQDPSTPKTTFHDVAGVEQAQIELQDMVDFLRDPQKFQKLGGRMPKGVLLIGPPGTGKTLLARAIAGEAGVPFFSISGSDFVEMFVGVGASRVRDLFEQGKKNAPCIIFIDEIDAVGRHRGAGLGGGHDEREQTLNQLLVEMDGFESNEGVILVAATTRPDVLDPALLRPGRFDRRVVVGRPDVKGREQILKVHTKKVPLADDVDLTTIARGSPGFAGADLANLVNEAALVAARQNRKVVTQFDFELAKDKVMMGVERKSLIISDEEKKNTAYHEAGHALVAITLPEADPLHKVTIIPRGMALGVTMQLPIDDKHSYNKEYLETQLSILMAGRIAEEMFMNHITTGARNDIERATDLARKMVCEWGMSELGPISLGQKEEQIFLGREIAQHRDYSEATAIRIDEQVKKLVQDGYDRSKKVIEEHSEALVKIAESLLVREILDGNEVMQIV